MALKKCKECGKEISSKAFSCPNCGHNNLFISFLICGFLLFGLFILFVYLKNDPKQEDSADINYSQTNVKHTSNSSGLNKASTNAVEFQISYFMTALATYKLDNKHYPSTKEGLQALVKAPGKEEFWEGPYMKKIPKDLWGNEYRYICNDRKVFKIISSGPDGIENTTDDISNKGLDE